MRIMKQLLVPTAAVLLLFMLLGIVLPVFKKRGAIDPLPEFEVERTVTEKGNTYKLHKGRLYRVNSQ